MQINVSLLRGVQVEGDAVIKSSSAANGPPWFRETRNACLTRFWSTRVFAKKFCRSGFHDVKVALPLTMSVCVRFLMEPYMKENNVFEM